MLNRLFKLKQVIIRAENTIFRENGNHIKYWNA